MRIGGIGQVWLSYEIVSEYMNCEHGYVKQSRLHIQVSNAMPRGSATGNIANDFFDSPGMTNLLPWARCIIDAIGRKIDYLCATLSRPLLYIPT